MTRRGYATQDGMRAADVTLSAVRVGPEAVLAGPDTGLAVLERVVDEAIAALSAEAVGAMAALHELTVEYLKTRKQFGVPIGSFQVLQHRVGRHVGGAGAGAQHGGLRHHDGRRARCRASGARPSRRPRCRSAARRASSARPPIQLHGGIGMTMEYKAGHYFKRLTMIEMAYGDADHHLRLLAAAGGLS